MLCWILPNYVVSPVVTTRGVLFIGTASRHATNYTIWLHYYYYCCCYYYYYYYYFYYYHYYHYYYHHIIIIIIIIIFIIIVIIITTITISIISSLLLLSLLLSLSSLSLSYYQPLFIIILSLSLSSLSSSFLFWLSLLPSSLFYIIIIIIIIFDRIHCIMLLSNSCSNSNAHVDCHHWHTSKIIILKISFNICHIFQVAPTTTVRMYLNMSHPILYRRLLHFQNYFVT